MPRGLNVLSNLVFYETVQLNACQSISWIPISFSIKVKLQPENSVSLIWLTSFAGKDV